MKFQLITSTSALLTYSSLATTFADTQAYAYAGKFYLKGAAQAQAQADNLKYEEDFNTNTVVLGHSYMEEDNGEDSSYTYQLRMDLSSPLSYDYNVHGEGMAQIDKCIGWDSNVSPTNFTWYGISLQLPDDARLSDWTVFHRPIMQPLKEDGFVQLFGDEANGVVDLKFTTSADRPIIRARINDITQVFLTLDWPTFEFDFSDGRSVAKAGWETGVKCKVAESADGATLWREVVTPTMDISLERLV